MGAVTGFATKSQVTAPSLTTPDIEQYTAVLANTEYSLTLPANTKQFQIFWTDGGSFRVGEAVGAIALGKYVPLPAHAWIAQGGITAPTVTLYYQASKPNSTFTIYSWS